MDFHPTNRCGKRGERRAGETWKKEKTAEADPRRVLGDSTAVTQSLQLGKVCSSRIDDQGTLPRIPGATEVTSLGVHGTQVDP